EPARSIRPASPVARQVRRAAVRPIARLRLPELRASFPDSGPVQTTTPEPRRYPLTRLQLPRASFLRLEPLASIPSALWRVPPATTAPTPEPSRLRALLPLQRANIQQCQSRSRLAGSQARSTYRQ